MELESAGFVRELEENRTLCRDDEKLEDIRYIFTVHVMCMCVSV